MGDEGGKGRMDHRTARLPAQNNRCLTVVETLDGRTRKMREGILVAANQGEKIPPRGEVNKMPPGEAENVGETLYGRLAGSKKLDGVRTPVHLTLKPGLCLEADNGRFLGGRSEDPQPVPEDTDAAIITGNAKFFKKPLTGRGYFSKSCFSVSS